MRLSRTHPLFGLLVTLGTGCGMVAGLGDPKVQEQDGGMPPDEASVEGGAGTVQALRIAMGRTHGCAVIEASAGSSENGTVRCWGSNAAGELGTDPATTPSSPIPVAVDGFPPNTSAAELALSAQGSCAITVDSFLFCWGTLAGTNPSGVHPEVASPAYQPSQMDLHGSPLISVTGASVGDNGGCALADQSLVCWGTGSFEPGSSPDAGVVRLDAGPDGAGVAIGDAFDAIAVGQSHVCGIATRSGKRDVECWGDNTYGQTGIPPGGSVTYPNQVGIAAFGDIAEVASGADHSCARLTNGNVYCWGRNDHGQLGNPSVVGDTNVPTPVAFARGTSGGQLTALELALGDNHSCAVMDNQHVQCWGDDSADQVGIGASAPPWNAQPSDVLRVLSSGPSSLLSVNHIAAGGGTTCVTRWANPNVWCWGQNDEGQAGQAPGASLPYATAMPW